MVGGHPNMRNCIKGWQPWEGWESLVQPKVAENIKVAENTGMWESLSQLECAFAQGPLQKIT